MPKLNLTVFLILITVFSKLIGFVREMMLLGSVGISAGLDLLVVFFSFSTFMVGVIGTLVVTNLTPLMAKMGPTKAIPLFLVESVKVASSFTVILLLWNSAYLSVALADHPEILLGGQLAGLMAAILFFSIIAEYQVALFLSQNRQIPVISGNILISLPLVLGLIFLDISILSYAVGLALAFALRALVFTVLLRPTFQRNTQWWRKQFWQKPFLFRNIAKILLGGSAMLAVSLVFLVAIMLAERQSVGAATLLAYGRKIPMLVLTSVWFVLGSRFFSNIVKRDGRGSYKLILRLTCLNGAITAFFAVLVLCCIALTNFSSVHLTSTQMDFVEVINASLPLLPIIVFLPIIEMTQRTLVTLNNHRRILWITAAALATASVGFSISSVLWVSPLSIMLTITLSLGIGALSALLALKVMRDDTPND